MEHLFIAYFWLTPLAWVILTLSNRILGKRIATMNREMFGYDSPDYKGALNTFDVLRLILFIPASILWWWISTQQIVWHSVYLAVIGYQLLLWFTAVVRQLSGLFLRFFLRHFNFDTMFRKENSLKLMNLNYFSAASDYLGYFLVYSFLAILTQSWFVAGGAIACFVAVLRHNRKARKMAGTLI